MRFLILALFLISCTNARNNTDLETIVFDSDSGSVKIKKNTTSSFGPFIKSDQETIDSGAEQSKVVALNFYPSLYESLAIIPYLKELEKQKTKISVISSFGFGAVLSALYAKEKSVSYLEWKIFDLMKRLDGVKIYSKDWQSKINEFMGKEFGKTKLHQMKVLMVIPEIKKNKVYLNQTGSIVEAIRHSIDLNSNSNYLRNIKKFDTNLTHKSVDIVVNAVFISSDSKIKNIDNYRFGILTSYLGTVLKELDKTSILKLSSAVILDEARPLSEISEQYSELISENVGAVKLKVESLKEENTQILNN